MIFKKLLDYGGYSCGWKCILCGEIIDQIQEIHPSPQECLNEKERWKMGKGF
jgi:hypothetical protein